jgi:hypothetical protein
MLREVALELALDFARYGGNTFPCVDLGEAPAVDAPVQSGQARLLLNQAPVINYLSLKKIIKLGCDCISHLLFAVSNIMSFILVGWSNYWMS